MLRIFSLTDLPRFQAIVRWILFRFWFLTRGMTVGVRCVLINSQNEVLLIKHSYIKGWQFPGGGVEVGETFEEALRRETEEEACIELTERPELFGLYHNAATYKRDHVALYVVRAFKEIGTFRPNAEIIDHQWFAMDSLPSDISKATKARLDEIFHNTVKSSSWT